MITFFLNHEIKFKHYLPLTKQRALGSVSGDQLGDGKHAGWTFSLKFRGESNFKITQSLFWSFPSLYARSWFQIFCTTVLAWLERSSFFLYFSIYNWWVTQSDSVFINKRFIFEIFPYRKICHIFPLWRDLSISSSINLLFLKIDVNIYKISVYLSSIETIQRSCSYGWGAIRTWKTVSCW